MYQFIISSHSGRRPKKNLQSRLAYYNLLIMGVGSRALHGLEIWAQARPANMISGPALARSNGKETAQPAH